LKPVGVLIVTRLREDANSIQNTINALAGHSVAVVYSATIWMGSARQSGWRVGVAAR
jgi:hypothetical protein